MPKTRINLCQSDHEGSVSGFASDEELAAASGFLQVQIIPVGFLNKTGIIAGGDLSINGGDNATFDVAAGSGFIIDNHTTPGQHIQSLVSWSAFVAESTTAIATSGQTYIAINSSGVLTQQTNSFTKPDDYRDLIIIGIAQHPFGAASGLVNTLNIVDPAIDAIAHSKDFIRAVGNINVSGNVYAPSGVNLSMTKSLGSLYRMGSNWSNSKKNPHILTTIAANPVVFSYFNQDGGGGFTRAQLVKFIDPNNYDNGTGTLASVPTNDWSIQRIYLCCTENSTNVQYGQVTYDKKAFAIDSIFSEEATIDQDLVEESTFRGWLVVKEGATDLSDIGQAVFIEANKFGTSAGGGGATSATTTLQQAYNNSEAEDQIVLTETNGGFHIHDAATPITSASLFHVTDNTEATTHLEVTTGGIASDGSGVFQQPLYETNVRIPSGSINIGAGQGIYASKLLGEQRFKSLVGGSGVDLAATATEITIETNEDAGLVAVQDTPPISPSIGRVWLDTSSCASGVPQSLPIGHITSNYFPTFLDTVLLADASAGPFAVFLPMANGINFGKTYHIKKIDATGNTVTIQPSGSSTIDGSTNKIMISQYNSMMIISDGNNWFIL